MQIKYEPNGVYSATLNGRIWGVGFTAEDAKADAEKNLAKARSRE